MSSASAAAATGAMERQLRAWGLDVNAANVTLYTYLEGQ